MRALWAAASLAVLLPGAFAQPPLPPAARPSELGIVRDVEPAESIRLETGVLAPISEATMVTGPHDSPLPGDLVELRYGPQGIVSHITILPRRPQLYPLSHLRADQGAVYHAYWQHEGKDYPDSLRTAGLRLRVAGGALQLQGQAAYEAQEPADQPPSFAILDQDGNALWQQQIMPGQVVPFRCSLRGVSYLQLKCAQADGEPVSDWACLWLSPMLVLRQMEYVALRPALSEQLAEQLAAGLGGLDPGAVAIGVPEVIGLADGMARDLRDDLFVAAGARFRLAGALPRTTAWTPTESDRTAAEALGATTLLVSQIRYRGPETQIRARLLTVADNEQLATAEVRFE